MAAPRPARPRRLRLLRLRRLLLRLRRLLLRLRLLVLRSGCCCPRFAAAASSGPDGSPPAAPPAIFQGRATGTMTLEWCVHALRSPHRRAQVASPLAGGQAAQTPDDPTRPKFYALDMFPYPSGSGLHVGHCEGYTATDIITRWKRMQGWNVLHPMGWDALRSARRELRDQARVHPRIITEQSIATFRRQIDSVGFAYDWSARSTRPIRRT